MVFIKCLLYAMDWYRQMVSALLDSWSTLEVSLPFLSCHRTPDVWEPG